MKLIWIILLYQHKVIQETKEVSDNFSTTSVSSLSINCQFHFRQDLKQSQLKNNYCRSYSIKPNKNIQERRKNPVKYL